MQSCVNLVFEGGGAKGALYAGTLRALQKKDLKIESAIGTSAGSLASVIFALNVPADDMQDFFDPHAPKPEGLHSPILIQDRIPEETRARLMKQNEKKYSNLLAKINWIFPLILEKYLGYKFYEGVEHAFDSSYIAQELALNGSFIAGYGLVSTVEDFLNKYLPSEVVGEYSRKNITLKEFKKVTGVNVAMVGSDITSGMPRILSATTAPDLPVKYGVRISASIPFYFPPIYWDPKWGRYMGQSINEHMFVDGGVLWNLPISAILTTEELQMRYMGQVVDPSTVAAFYFNHILGQLFNFEDSMVGVEDADITRIPEEYRINIKKSTKPDSWDDFGFIKTAPGIFTALQLVPSVILGMGTNFEVEKYASKIGPLESKNISMLNFGLNGVDVGQEIENAERVSTELFDKLNL